MGDMIPGLVSIIIPTMKRSKFESFDRMSTPLRTLRDLLGDIHSNVTMPFEVIVVCNETSSRAFRRFIMTSKHIHRHCMNSENVGVPRSWNIGAQLSKGELLLFVNDDVEIGADAVEALAREIARDPGVGMVGPAGTKWDASGPGDYVGITASEEADAISGWCFMTTRHAFLSVGGFDVSYTPALMEEIDYSFAVREKGFVCRVLPGLNLTHHHVSGASSTNLPIAAMGISLLREDLTSRNRKYFKKKWRNLRPDVKPPHPAE